MKTYKYGVQWIDQGGEDNFGLDNDMLGKALKKIGLTIDIVVNVGGIKVKSKYGHCAMMPEFDYFWYIETNTPLPEWKKGRNAYDINHIDNMNRFDQELKSWFYTFDLEEDTVIQWLSYDEHEELREE